MPKCVQKVNHSNPFGCLQIKKKISAFQGKCRYFHFKYRYMYFEIRDISISDQNRGICI